MEKLTVCFLSQETLCSWGRCQVWLKQPLMSIVHMKRYVIDFFSSQILTDCWITMKTHCLVPVPGETCAQVVLVKEGSCALLCWGELLSLVLFLFFTVWVTDCKYFFLTLWCIPFAVLSNYFILLWKAHDKQLFPHKAVKQTMLKCGT